MTIAQRLEQKGLEKGLEKGIQLGERRGIDRNTVMAMTGLTEKKSAAHHPLTLPRWLLATRSLLLIQR